MRHSHVYILFRLNVEVHQNSKHECFQTRRWYEPFIGHTHPAYENVEIKIRCRYVESSYSGIHTLSRAFAFGRRFCILQDCANIFVSNFCRLFLFSLSQRTVLKSNMQQSSFFSIVHAKQLYLISITVSHCCLQEKMWFSTIIVNTDELVCLQYEPITDQLFYTLSYEIVECSSKVIVDYQ